MLHSRVKFLLPLHACWTLHYACDVFRIYKLASPQRSALMFSKHRSIVKFPNNFLQQSITQ